MTPHERALEAAKLAVVKQWGKSQDDRQEFTPEAIARAAVTAYLAEAGDGWMPIETLPAEGLYLLASNAGPEHSVHHAGHFFEVWSARSYHAAINPNSTPAQRTLLREAQLVTHWRPLPLGPKEKSHG